MKTALITVDSLRYDHLDELPRVRERLQWHDRAYTTHHATSGVFPTVHTGEFVSVDDIADRRLLAERVGGVSAAAVDNRLISERYGYDQGFDNFQSPHSSGSWSLKSAVSERLSSRGRVYRLASALWNGYQSVHERFAAVERSFKTPDELISDLPPVIFDATDWFVWIHLMGPHHPYDPDIGYATRSEAQAASRRLISGSASPADERLGRRLYRDEVRAIDEPVAEFIDSLDDFARVIFAADHGELFGEDCRWGHPPAPREALLHVPFGYRNIEWRFGPTVSLIDIPSMVTGEIVGRGQPDREVAYATPDDGRPVAIDRHGIRRTEAQLETGSQFDGREEDLRALGYLSEEESA